MNGAVNGNGQAPRLSLGDLEAALVRHGVIQAAAIDDAEGYDAGATREGVLKVFEDLERGMGLNNSITGGEAVP